MKRSFQILTILVTCLHASCAIPSFMLPTADEREETLRKFEAAWERGESVKAFGLERAVAVVDRKQSTAKKFIPLGMASVLTTDGYALTAEHVLEDDTGSGVVVVNHQGRLLPAHLGTARMTFMRADGTVKKQVDWPGFVGCRIYQQGERESVEVGDVEIQELRVIARFPALDLALVHCDIEPSATFELTERPQSGEVLFASGNPFRHRASAAGEVHHVKPSRGGEVIHMSIPLSPGDSGGPVFDGQGGLVGVVTNGFPKQLKFFPASIARRMDSRTLRDLIADDRAKRRAEMGAPRG